VLGFTAWVYQSAFDKELAAVNEKHLLLSRNLTGALARYAADSETAFRTVVADLIKGQSSDGHPLLLSGMHFRHISIVDVAGGVSQQLCVDACPAMDRLPPDIHKALVPLFEAVLDRAGRVRFSGAMKGIDGRPAVFLVKATGDGRVVLGELSNSYLLQLQASVAFGTKGHAAIFDQRGRVLAHPRAEWVEKIKDLSELSVVASMERGESGVARFYSPAIDADMIAGYSTVPKVGWGVMVPQPVTELESKARDVEGAAVIFGALALLATGLASWLLASYFDRAIRPVVEAARRNAAGSIGAEAIGLPRLAPLELRELAEAFNVMARGISLAFLNEREALAEARRAEDTNRAKTEVMAKVSHEFRTPLNAIMGFAEMIKEQVLGPVGNRRYLEYADAVHRSGLHLLGLIDDVLDISRADLGRVSLHEEWIGVPELIEDAVAIVREAHRHEAHDRQVTLEPDLPLVKVDRQMIRQILINLLSNAEKFTPAGGRITLASRRTEEGGVELSVTDTGVGIDTCDLGLVVTPFGRATKGSARDTPGTGLGLTLAKSLAELHGGELDIESELDSGTTVRVLLPASRVGGPEGASGTDGSVQAA